MIKEGIWKHSKSGVEYRVIGVGKHSETEEDVVVYQSLTDNKLWVRPARMWEEEVGTAGAQHPRFVFVRES
jgi:hypothetical protein